MAAGEERMAPYLPCRKRCAIGSLESFHGVPHEGGSEVARARDRVAGRTFRARVATSRVKPLTARPTRTRNGPCLTRCGGEGQNRPNGSGASVESRPEFRVMAKVTIRIDLSDRGAIGPGKIRLLELVGESGSISAAGRAMSMSYRRAWLLIDGLNQCFRTPVVETQLGGNCGGCTILT